MSHETIFLKRYRYYDHAQWILIQFRTRRWGVVRLAWWPEGPNVWVGGERLWCWSKGWNRNRLKTRL